MIFFRADSNSQIASGHIMRCISLATYFKEQGEEVRFLIADEHPISMLETHGMAYTNLCSKWDDLTVELQAVANLLKKEDQPTLFIDTYQVSKAYVDAMLPYAKVAYIGSKQAYLGELDLLVNYSTDIDTAFYQEHYNKGQKLLLGPTYAPLRKEFQGIAEHYNADTFNLLLTTGNTDQHGCVNAVLEAIIHSPIFKEIAIDVVVGGMFKDADRLTNSYAEYDNIRFHRNVKSMSALMKESALAISANGTTVYELAAAHVPTLSVAMVPEQVRSAEALSVLGAVDYAGEIFSDKQRCITHLMAALENLYQHPEQRMALGRKAHALIDGNGCEKIYNEIKSLTR